MDWIRYMQWLYQSRKGNGLAMPNFIITLNHIHLIVIDVAKRNVIAKSAKLIAGRCGQECNQRKNRKGCCEERYHATAVENGEVISTARARYSL